MSTFLKQDLTASLKLSLPAFRIELIKHIELGHRLITYFGSPVDLDSDFRLTAIFLTPSGLEMICSQCARNDHYHSLTPELPLFHCFEREIFEEFGLMPKGHPWLKPVRHQISDYPFFRVEGKEVHEVGVGPIHAGVIEPGHFRFNCYGETVHHLEIQLGYQNRGVEKLLLKQSPSKLTPLVETIAGDTSIGHALAYCQAWEALCDFKVNAEIALIRGIALELERIAMHLVGLAGLSNDIAFLPGSSTYGRLRTTVINMSMRICGSRFGRGWLRPGGVHYGLASDVSSEVSTALDKVFSDIQTINDLFQNAITVRHRLIGIGQVTIVEALKCGFVGMVARSCGLSIDLRTDSRGSPYESFPIERIAEVSGDCWARAILRIREIDASIKWIRQLLERLPNLPARMDKLAAPRPNTICISAVEGWRGEIVHCLETDSNGKLISFHVQDPSLRNWFALALSVRKNEISDFPICNKSFDLSYCGHDL